MLLTPQDLVSKWKRIISREKQTYQEHFIDVRYLKVLKRNASV
jgi:hypothetical protein